MRLSRTLTVIHFSAECIDLILAVTVSRDWFQGGTLANKDLSCRPFLVSKGRGYFYRTLNAHKYIHLRLGGVYLSWNVRNFVHICHFEISFFWWSIIWWIIHLWLFLSLSSSSSLRYYRKVMHLFRLNILNTARTRNN